MTGTISYPAGIKLLSFKDPYREKKRTKLPTLKQGILDTDKSVEQRSHRKKYPIPNKVFQHIFRKKRKNIPGWW